jgi:UDP-glucose 4-epimerase
MATYLVTGGCGFIGSHLADALLAAGHSVRILDDMSTGQLENKPPGASLIEGDVADATCVTEAMRGVDGCFHLAAVASVERGNSEWLETHRINLGGTITIFEAARRAKSTDPVPIVYASSAAVYGENPYVPLTEITAKRPLSAYGADKLGCEQHGFVAGRVHRIPTCGLRFFNVYGPRQNPASPYSGVISIFCDRLKSGRQPTIFGEGRQTRDFIFVGDVIDALLKAMARTSKDGNVYNVCTGHATSIRDLTETIADILGIKAEPNFGPPRSGEILHSLGNPSKAMKELGFVAKTSLKVGLETTLNVNNTVS